MSLMQKQALGNIRVLDMTRVLAGPWCTQMLGDMGADVIKIEHPSRGDDTRQWGPPYAMTSEAEVLEDSTYFASANRNKRSVGVDIANPDGADLIRKLVLECDIFVENFKVGDLARRGLDYDSLKKINPRLIYCSITGYGQSGTYADRPGYDFVIQGMGGIMDLTGEPDGAPQKSGVAFADIFTGLYSVIAIQAALAMRERTGRGQHIDMALLDVMTGVLANQAMNYFVSGTTPPRVGNAHLNVSPYAVFPCADGWFILAAGNDGQYLRAMDVLGIDPRPEWASNAGRLEHRAPLFAAIEAATRARTRADLLAALEAAGVPVGPINTVEQAFAEPQVVHRGMRIEVARADGTVLPGLRTPIRFSDAELALGRAAPRLGASEETG